MILLVFSIPAVSQQTYKPGYLPGQKLHRPSTTGANAIIADFRVNEGFGQYKYNCEDPVVSADGVGNFVIAWLEYRNDDWDIYAQQYDVNGVAQGNNFRVNEIVGSIIENSPSLATDAAGNFIITWTDNGYGPPAIYAQRYSNAGHTLGPIFKAGDTAGIYPQSNPAVAMNGDGIFIITWVDDRDAYLPDIYAQRFANDGTAIDLNFRVNDDPEISVQWYPAISIDNAGNFMIAWWDQRAKSLDC